MPLPFHTGVAITTRGLRLLMRSQGLWRGCIKQKAPLLSFCLTVTCDTVVWPFYKSAAAVQVFRRQNVGGQQCQTWLRSGLFFLRWGCRFNEGWGRWKSKVDWMPGYYIVLQSYKNKIEFTCHHQFAPWWAAQLLHQTMILIFFIYFFVQPICLIMNHLNISFHTYYLT